MPQKKQGGAEESETNVSVPQQEGQAEITSGKATAEYNPDIEYKSKVSEGRQQRGIICHPFQVAVPKSCQCDSIRSQDGFADVYV